MMTFLKILCGGVFLLFIGGFAYVAVTDVPIRQNETVETLPASHFQK